MHSQGAEICNALAQVLPLLRCNAMSLSMQHSPLKQQSTDNIYRNHCRPEPNLGDRPDLPRSAQAGSHRRRAAQQAPAIWGEPLHRNAAASDGSEGGSDNSHMQEHMAQLELCTGSPSQGESYDTCFWSSLCV